MNTVRSSEQQVRARHQFEERTLLVFVGVVIATVGFGLLAVLARAKSATLFHWDVEVSDDVHKRVVGHGALIGIMRFFSFIGSPVVWWVILGATALWLAYRRLPRLAIFVVTTAVGSSLLNHLTKTVVGRARPHFDNPIVNAAGKSFPSGHAQAAIVGYGVLLVVFVPTVARRWRALVVAVGAALALAIGISRIALGAHFVSDVIGGYLAGAAWLLGMGQAFRTWRRAEGRPAPPISEGLEPEHTEELRPSHPRAPAPTQTHE